MPASGVFFKGSSIKNLKDEIEFFSARTSSFVKLITNSIIDPTSTAVDANAGSILTTQSGLMFLKRDDGSTTNWKNISDISPTLDIFYSESFEVTNAADLCSGNNATFDNGGTLDGALADETASPLSGGESVKYTMSTASTNDWFHTGAISLDEKQKGQFFSWTFYAKYDGSVDEIKAVIWDDTNNSELATVNINNVDSSRYVLTAFVPLSSSSLKLGFHVLTGNNTKVLTFDDFEASMNPFSIFEGDDRVSMAKVHTRNGFGSTNTKIRRYTTQQIDLGAAISYTDSATLGGAFTINEDGVYAMSLTEGGDATNNSSGISLNSAQLTTNILSIATADRLCVEQENGGNTMAQSSWSGFLSAGDVIRVHTAGTNSTQAAAQHSFTIVQMRSQSSNIVVQNSQALNSSIRVNTFNGYGSTNTKIRRFTTITDDFGSAITYADSATLGGSFTVNEDGVYSISSSDNDGNLGGADFGISKNSSQLTTNVNSIATADRLAADTTSSSGDIGNASWQGILKAGDVIRAHTNGGISGTAARATFTITKIGTTQTTGVPLPRYARVRDEKTTGTVGGTATTSAWTTRILNTVVDGDFISLSSNQFTLPKGTYLVEWDVPFYGSSASRSKLRNVTDSSDVELSQSGYAHNASAPTFVSHGYARFSITSAKAFEIQYFVLSAAGGTSGLGNVSSDGGTEYYTDVQITKVE